LIEKVPGVFGLNDVGVGIDDHDLLLWRIIFYDFYNDSGADSNSEFILLISGTGSTAAARVRLLLGELPERP
jgi:hypothetical protein